MFRFRILAIALLAALIALPSFAYTIYLKDGTTIRSKGPYEERDGNAYFTYPNGNKSFLDLDLIDAEKTISQNQSDIGGAAVIQESEIIEETVEPAPKKRTLGDMIRERNRSTQRTPPPPATSSTPAETSQPEEAPLDAPMTSAGYQDLIEFERVQFRDLDLVAGIVGSFQSQSVDGVGVYRGTRSSHALVTVTANSEGAVLRAVAVAARALGQISELSDGQFEAIELLISTPTGQRAGQFVITKELADELLAGSIDPTAFYVENVQF